LMELAARFEDSGADQLDWDALCDSRRPAWSTRDPRGGTVAGAFVRRYPASMPHTTDITSRELHEDTGAALRRAESGERLRVLVGRQAVAQLGPLDRRHGTGLGCRAVDAGR
jgi:hypothetical protein